MIKFSEFLKERYNLGLIESLDSPVPVKYQQSQHTLDGYFSVNDKKFKITFDIVKEIKFVHVSFRRLMNDNKYTIDTLNDLKPKEVLQVYSTIAVETKKFINYDCIYFSSNHPKKLNSYLKVAQKIKTNEFIILTKDEDIEIVRKDIVSKIEQIKKVYLEGYTKIKD